MKMKPTAALLICLFLSNVTNAQFVAEMRYLKNNEVMFNDRVIKKAKHLQPIIEAKNNEELNATFKKYRRVRFTQQAVARIRDVGMFYGVLDVYVQPRIQAMPLAIGLSGMGGAALLRRPSNDALKNLVEEYNDIILLEKIQQEKQLSARGNQ